MLLKNDINWNEVTYNPKETMYLIDIHDRHIGKKFSYAMDHNIITFTELTNHIKIHPEFDDESNFPDYNFVKFSRKLHAMQNYTSKNIMNLIEKNDEIYNKFINNRNYAAMMYFYQNNQDEYFFNMITAFINDEVLKSFK